MIKSVSYSQQEIIQDIINLHLGGRDIECDPCYSKGNFYKKINKPIHRYDLVPQDTQTVQADCRNLPLIGEKGPNWKGGRTKRLKILRNRADYKHWRNSVFKRDNYTCQKCGSKSGNGKRVNLNAHHIVPVSQNELLMYEVTNGVTLCRRCHEEEHPHLLKQSIKLSKRRVNESNTEVDNTTGGTEHSGDSKSFIVEDGQDGEPSRTDQIPDQKQTLESFRTLIIDYGDSDIKGNRDTTPEA